MNKKIKIKENKQPIGLRLKPEMSKRLENASEKTGLKKTTIIEQGLDKRLKELGE